VLARRIRSSPSPAPPTLGETDPTIARPSPT
jgi:hypothetical protein